MVVPSKIELVERNGCAFCQNKCQFIGKQARSDSRVASKDGVGRKYGCHSEVYKWQSIST
jgi:hypothetical protein